MTTTESPTEDLVSEFAGLHPDLQQRALDLALLAHHMDTGQRAAAGEMFADTCAVIALTGTDRLLGAALMIRKCSELLLISGREEHRTQTRQEAC